MSPTHQDLSNDTTFSQIKSRVPVPIRIDGGAFISMIAQYSPSFYFASLPFILIMQMCSEAHWAGLARDRALGHAGTVRGNVMWAIQWISKRTTVFFFTWQLFLVHKRLYNDWTTNGPSFLEVGISTYCKDRMDKNMSGCQKGKGSGIRLLRASAVLANMPPSNSIGSCALHTSTKPNS